MLKRSAIILLVALTGTFTALGFVAMGRMHHDQSSGCPFGAMIGLGTCEDAVADTGPSAIAHAAAVGSLTVAVAVAVFALSALVAALSIVSGPSVIPRRTPFPAAVDGSGEVPSALRSPIRTARFSCAIRNKRSIPHPTGVS